MANIRTCVTLVSYFVGFMLKTNNHNWEKEEERESPNKRISKKKIYNLWLMGLMITQITKGACTKCIWFREMKVKKWQQALPLQGSNNRIEQEIVFPTTIHWFINGMIKFADARNRRATEIQVIYGLHGRNQSRAPRCRLIFATSFGNCWWWCRWILVKMWIKDYKGATIITRQRWSNPMVKNGNERSDLSHK